MGKYQLVSWLPEWLGFRVLRFNPEKTNMGTIYDWFLMIGFCEIRKWKKARPKVKEYDMYQILKPTMCIVGRHSWTWTGCDTTDEPLDRNLLCSCGKYPWWQRNYIKEQVVEIQAKSPDLD